MTGQLTPDILLSAYRAGIFPMAESATHKNIFWVDPKYRGILPLNKFHVSRSLSQAIMKLDYRISVNTSFEKVIKMCADRPETWINREIIKNYLESFKNKIFGITEISILDSIKNSRLKTKSGFRLQIFESSSVEEANRLLNKNRKVLIILGQGIFCRTDGYEALEVVKKFKETEGKKRGVGIKN